MHGGSPLACEGTPAVRRRQPEQLESAGEPRRTGAAQRAGRADGLRAALEEWHVLYVAVTRAIDTLILPPRLFDWLG